MKEISNFNIQNKSKGISFSEFFKNKNNFLKEKNFKNIQNKNGRKQRGT